MSDPALYDGLLARAYDTFLCDVLRGLGLWRRLAAERSGAALRRRSPPARGVLPQTWTLPHRCRPQTAAWRGKHWRATAEAIDADSSRRRAPGRTWRAPR